MNWILVDGTLINLDNVIRIEPCNGDYRSVVYFNHSLEIDDGTTTATFQSKASIDDWMKYLAKAVDRVVN